MSKLPRLSTGTLLDNTDPAPDLAALFGLGDEHTWQERAACASADPESFFVEKGGSTVPAKRVCRGCPVKSECLAYAIGHAERWGVWGGLSERERRRVTSGKPAPRRRGAYEPAQGEYPCPEPGCGRVFLSPFAVGGHRSKAHRSPSGTRGAVA